MSVNSGFSFDKNAESTNQKAASKTRDYPNLFTEILEKSEVLVRARVEASWDQLFYGDDETERVYYPVEPDMAYIKDIWNHDVRTEGMSYGMMIAVQLDKKTEFDRLWKWAKTYMQHKTGQRNHYFAWQLKTDGTILDPNSAADGEEWFTMALIFASARWGDGEGIYNYKTEAQALLDAMLSKAEVANDDNTISNMFNRREKQVVFVPVGNADDFTDPSYHLPHFYELWAKWADKENDFWNACAATSREFFKKTVHPKTGLAPDYAHFDGSPVDPWHGGHGDFRYDAWRVAMNIGMDYSWFGKDDWQIGECNRLLDFFHSEGLDSYVNQYSLDGKRLTKDRSSGLTAMNAVACLAATSEHRKEFVQALWDLPIPKGEGRYYDGMLYMLAMLQVSGNFRIYLPVGE
ncbi:glycoside hydrolase [candidate division KSB1 bacterium]|nr:glycoside hydrolase [candidate division KSB1 bacterium]